VLMTPMFDVLAIIRVPYAAVRRHARRNQRRFSFRWTGRSMGYPWVDVLYLAGNKQGDGVGNVRRTPDPRGPKGK
jgi:hypothetical protein